MIDWYRSLRRAWNAQAGHLRGTYGWDDVIVRETWTMTAWPRCTWSWRSGIATGRQRLKLRIVR